ncbi:MAG: hypothetical protein GY866_23215 [Proteobacteria bacterium]|nr:hypothetical protein [Pseudomonadota bacterium]
MKVLESVERRVADNDPAVQAILDFMQGDPLAYLEQMRDLQTEGDDSPQGMAANYGPTGPGRFFRRPSGERPPNVEERPATLPRRHQPSLIL